MNATLAPTANSTTGTKTHTDADTPIGSARSIGDMLVAKGRLTSADLGRILARQEQDKTPFGEAAIALRLLTKTDIDQVLGQQFDYPYLSPSDHSLSPELVAAYQPFSRAGENLRAVRSQLMLRWLNNPASGKALAIVSPGAGEGRSFCAANLAIVFAQQGQRTLLIDADLRAKANRAQHALFKLSHKAGLSDVLADRAAFENAAQAVPSLPGLVVLPAGAVPPNPQELLGRPGFDAVLQTAARHFDVILIDTPSAGAFSDAEIIASRAGAALLVTRLNKTLLPTAAQLSHRLQGNGVAVVGSVLNDA